MTAKQAERKKYRVAYLVSHPIQYQAPMLRFISENSSLIDLSVLFMSDFSLREYVDKGFGAKVSWDVPLLEGYRSEILPSLGANAPLTALRPFNTGLSNRLRSDQIDALWMHGYAHLTNIRAMAIAKANNIPILIRAESQQGSVIRNQRTRHIKESFLRWVFSKASAFLSVGTRNKQYYQSLGVSENRIFSMPYTVDNSFFQQSVANARPNRETLRESLGLMRNRPIILFASKLQKRKRASDLLKAYVKLSEDGNKEPVPYLIFIGDGEERASLEAEASELGWSSIRFLGFKNQTELPSYFDLCDVFVLVSEREQWGLIINEVMNAGKPIIVSDGVGATDDLVVDGVNGYVVPTGNIDTLSNRLRRLTNEPDSEHIRLHMGDRSRLRINSWGFHEDLTGLEAAVRFCCT